MTLKSILGMFHLASGLNIDFVKGKFIGVGMTEKEIKCYAKLLNCQSLSTAFLFLGIQISTNPRRMDAWQLVVDKFKRKLALWKNKFLS